MKPMPKKMSRGEYKKAMSKLMRMDHIFLCEFCIFVLKQRLKKFNSLTLPVIKGRLMENEPDLLNLNKMASDVYNIIAYKREKLKRMVEAEESKLQCLKALKGNDRKAKQRKKKEDLKSVFFKKRRAVKASLLKMGMKNPECVLRAYEMFTLKTPSKTGRVLRSQEEVAKALVEEGLTEKCSQQSVSRWNNTVERELKR